METIGIAFEGCGCKAAFHVGVMELLLEAGVDIEVATGASSGALIAAMVGLRREREMRPAMEALLGTPVFQPQRFFRSGWPWAMTDIVGGALADHVGDIRLADVPRKIAIPVSHPSLLGWSRRVLTAQDDLSLKRAVLASCFFPGPYSRMVPIDRRPTFDGAITGRVPVAEAFALGATKVIGCVSHPDRQLRRGVLRKRRVDAPRGDLLVIGPREELSLGTFDFDQERMLAAFDAGREAGEKLVSSHWLAAPSAS